MTSAPQTMRVVHVIDSLGSGGAEHNLVNLLLAGDRSSFQHHVVALYHDDSLGERLRNAGINVLVVGGQGPRDLTRILGRVTAAIKADAPNLVHTQLVMSDLIGRAAVLLSGRRPMLSTLQNRPYDPEASGIEIPSAVLAMALRLADRWLGRLTRTRHIAVSEAVRSSYARHMGIPSERIEVIYNSVDLTAFRPRTGSPSEKMARRQALGIGEAPLLLNVARHTRQKGLFDLLDAVDSSVVRSTGAHLLLVGSGPDTRSIRERIAALSLDTRVTLLGRRHDVAELMEVSDVFVLPSRYEGLPLALLEALAIGLPVVASDLPEIREATTEDASVLVPTGQPGSLARAIADLLGAPEKARALARLGRRQVEERFDLRKNALRFEDALRRAAQPCGGGS